MTAATTAICSLPKTLPEEQAVTSAVPQLGGRKVGKNPWNCSLECAVHDWEGAGEGENPGFAACPVGAAFCLPGCSEHSLLCLPDGENKQQKKAPSSMRFRKIPGDSVKSQEIPGDSWSSSCCGSVLSMLCPPGTG